MVGLVFGIELMGAVELGYGLMFGVDQILSTFDFLYYTLLFLIILLLCKTTMK